MLKQISIVLLTLLLGFSLQAQQPTTQPTSRPATQPSSQLSSMSPKMTFETKLIDLGDVKRGEVKKFEFKYVNTGNAPMKIELISSCDCTTTDYARMEVQPGEASEIQVTFDSAEKEESETIDIDIYLQNEDPETGIPIIEMIQYKYNLIIE